MSRTPSRAMTALEREVEIPVAGGLLQGRLAVPEDALGLVLFAHGSGSSRLSPRNRHVAETLERSGLATLLFDLLTEREEGVDRRTGSLRFDIGLLARRLREATDWVLEEPSLHGLPIGYFGASTGAAAALVAAAERPEVVRAVVSRGGRPDLAGPALPLAVAPTLLIVGGDDRTVIGLNREAERRMTAPVTIEIVPGASHLFEEPGTLDRAAELAAGWFRSHLPLTRPDRGVGTGAPERG
ncbi:MAG TPA: dienelactone hydrolase family protein [Longimicrobiaceae bacterium]|nr:dienelactone hydrolase family protein [Longimicrobiaceae bacterium]